MTTLDLKKQFGAAVKRRRTQMQISQEELAGRAGLHRTYITDIERGARNLSLESIAKLARALEMPISSLFLPAGRVHSFVGEPGAELQFCGLVEILMVEDDSRDVELTLHAFKRAGITNPVHVAGDGAEALDYLFCVGRHSKRRPDHLPGLILLDLNLPKLHGLEVLRRIKRDARTRRIPVVVLSISQEDEHIRKARRLGAEAYVAKPVDFQRFSAVTPQLQFNWALLRSSPRVSA